MQWNTDAQSYDYVRISLTYKLTVRRQSTKQAWEYQRSYNTDVLIGYSLKKLEVKSCHFSLIYLSFDLHCFNFIKINSILCWVWTYAHFKMIQSSFLVTLVYFVIFVITITESTRSIEYLGQIQQRRERRHRKYGNSLIKDGFDIKSKLITLFQVSHAFSFFLFS